MTQISEHGRGFRAMLCAVVDHMCHHLPQYSLMRFTICGVYLNLLSSFSSVIPFTKDIKAFSSSAQRVRSESNVGKSSGLNRFVGDVPSQRWRQTHSANNVWTSVPRKPPYGKEAEARYSS